MENIVNGKILIGNVPWDSGYKNVVVWDDEKKAEYFGNSDYFYDHGFTLDSVQPLLKGGCVLPIPWEQLSCCNYLVYYPTYPISDIQYEDNVGEVHGFNTPMYFFINSVQYEAPNATSCELMIDVWTTYSQYIDMSATYLERGHYACMELREKFNSGIVTLQDSGHFRDKIEDINLNPDRILNEYVTDLTKLDRQYQRVNIGKLHETKVYQPSLLMPSDVWFAGEIGGRVEPSKSDLIEPNYFYKGADEDMVAIVYSIYDLITWTPDAPQLTVSDNFNIMSNIAPYVMSVSSFADFWRAYNGSPITDGIVDVMYVPNIGISTSHFPQGIKWNGRGNIVTGGVWSFGMGANKGNAHMQSAPSNHAQHTLRMTPYSFDVDILSPYKSFNTNKKALFSPSRLFTISNRQGQLSRFTLNDVWSDWNMNGDDPLRLKFDVQMRFEPGNGYVKVIPRLGAPGRPLHQITTTGYTSYIDTTNPNQITRGYNYPNNNDDIVVDLNWSNYSSKYGCGYTYYGIGKDMALYYDTFPHVAISQETFSRWMVANQTRIQYTKDHAQWGLDRARSSNQASYNNALAQMQAEQASFDASQSSMVRQNELAKQNYRYYSDMQFRQGNNTISRALAGGNVGKLGSNIFWNPSDVSNDLGQMDSNLQNALSSNQQSFNANRMASTEIMNRNFNLANSIAQSDYEMSLKQLNSEIESAKLQPDTMFGVNKGSDLVQMNEFKMYINEYYIGDRSTLNNNKGYWYRKYLGKYGWLDNTYYGWLEPINLNSDRMMCDRPGSVSYWKCHDTKLRATDRPAGLNEMFINTFKGILQSGVSVFDNPANIMVELELEVLEK
jgi:hypothetical protein